MIEHTNENLPITPEWLESIGFKPCKPHSVWDTPNFTWSNGWLDIWETEDGDWRWVECDFVSMTTRRKLNLLIEWADQLKRYSK